MGNQQDRNLITLAQLKGHNSQEDLWIAVHGKVYNLTSFAKDHPGGIEVLKTCAGTNGSETYEYAGHSSDAIKKIEHSVVGNLAGYGVNSAQFHAISSNSIEGTKTGGNPPLSTIINFRLIYNISTSMVLRTLILALLAGILWKIGGGDTLKGNIGFRSGHKFDPGLGFFSGFLIPAVLSSVGFLFLYFQFSKTLKHEKDVFSYPAIIPRRVSG
ncbi:hypothetical protein FQN53_009040 [Emmonsiellopsis sp. PD_33]|nr:hypothetical protein FQN53_009040 [Emmonsiellopsis sp. PD_33]